MLIKDPDIQPIFRMYIENVLATSDLRILKRLAALETCMGLNDFQDWLFYPYYSSVFHFCSTHIFEILDYSTFGRYDKKLCC